jgi:hypothetical protein
MHVVVVMVMIIVVVVMMVMHLGHRSGRSRLRGGRGRFLRDGVAGEADGKRGGGDKALDHGRSVLFEKDPSGLRAAICRTLPELNMNRVTGARN